MFHTYYGRNYSTPFCQTLMDTQCAQNIFDNSFNKIENNFTKKVGVKCKHSCTILQYSGLEVANRPATYHPELYDFHRFWYIFGNADNKMKSFHEYLIYDAIGMIGSVGGTLGMFIGFSMTGVISWVIEFFKNNI